MSHAQLRAGGQGGMQSNRWINSFTFTLCYIGNEVGWVWRGEFQACFGSLVLEWSRSAVAERAEKMKRTKLTALIMLSSVSVTRQTPAFPLIQCNWCKCKRKKKLLKLCCSWRMGSRSLPSGRSENSLVIKWNIFSLLSFSRYSLHPTKHSHAKQDAVISANVCL